MDRSPPSASPSSSSAPGPSTPTVPSMTKSAHIERLDSSNKGHQMMQRMGWRGAGLGSSEGGIVDPVSGGEVRDKQDQYRGVGLGTDPFEAFRKQKSGSFITRMRERPK